MERNRVTLTPNKDSPLAYNNSKIKIADDTYGGAARMGCHFHGERVLSFVNKFNQKPFTLVDIGANVGLFTRQLFVTMPLIVQKAFCYEPDQANYVDCVYNLNPWHGKATLTRAALGKHNGTMTLYRDGDNCGNYSELLSAMPDDHFDNVKVQVRDIALESANWAAPGLPIFYKSDIQGLDEQLTTFLDKKFWEKKCFAAILEIWRIQKPKIDTIKFREILSYFPHRAFASKPNAEINEDKIFEYLAGGLTPHDDLLLWK